MPNVSEMVTQRIIEQLEKGVIPWHKPWRGNPPMNYVTRKPYRGINPMLLPFGGEYVTFLQAKQLGGHVKKGEKGSMIVFYSVREAEDPDGDEKKPIPFLKHSVVFHLSQVEGIPSKLLPIRLDEAIKPIEAAKKIIDGYIARSGVKITHVIGNERAYYTPSSDTITMPAMGQFSNANAFYLTEFHEAAHSTGHPTRLNRDIGASYFGSQAYSREELVAEISAAALMNETGIEIEETFENSASYIDSWLGKFAHDKKMILFSSSAAQKATDMVLGLDGNKDDKE